LETKSASSLAKLAYNAFMYVLKSSESKRQYPARLKIFFDHLGLPGNTLEEQIEAFIEKSNDNGASEWIQSSIISFVNHYRKRVSVDRNLSAGTLNTYFQVVKLFCEMNDDIIPAIKSINWKRIVRGLPPTKSRSNDRSPTIEEIKKLAEYPDRRIKAIVYTMCSSGIRIGAWDFLKWGHIVPMQQEHNNNGGVAKIIVYAGEPEEYYSFITPEAHQALREWIDFRASYGEEITSESLLMRDLWPTSDIKYEAKRGLAKYPKPWKSHSIERTLSRALLEQGIREPLKNGSRRHMWKSSHGMRKLFKTRAESIMRPLNVELLMGHDSGISESYWRPSEQEVLQDYLKVVDNLTINTDKVTLQRQVSKLTESAVTENENTKRKLEQLTENHEKLREMLAGNMHAMSSVINMFLSQNENGEVSAKDVRKFIKDAKNMLEMTTSG
jgi:hypothetical protein